MALIPSESYSFPDHFVQTVSRARKASLPPSADLLEPVAESMSAPTGPAETEKQRQSVRSRWWQFVGFRESPKAEPVAAEAKMAPIAEPEIETPLAEPETSVVAASGWIEPAVQMEPAPAEMPIWAEAFEESTVEMSPAMPAEAEAAPIMTDAPISPMNFSTEMPPPLQVEEQPEPVIDQPPAAPLVEPEKNNATDEEVPGPRIFIPSLVPSTLKRKVRWNMRAAQAQENQSLSPNVAEFHGNEAPPESYAEPLLPPPVAQPPVKPKPELRPKISLMPPALEREKQAPQPVMPENTLPENNSIPAEELGCRIVEAPSADLVQTLLARALFGSTEPGQTTAPVLPQNHVINFAPAPPPPPKATSNGHLPPLTSQPKRAPVIERVMPATAPESVNESVLTGRRLRSAKFRRFIIFETIALAILIPLALLGLLRVFRDPTIILIVDIVTITSAIAATLMPILFFAVAPPLPRGEE